jgi:IMP dehydrogenase
MSHILEQEWLTTNDVSLVPKEGIVPSRTEVEISEPFLYSAPMDKVTGYHLTKVLSDLGQHPVVCRFLSSEERVACIKDFGHHPNVFFAIGLNELEEFTNVVNKVYGASRELLNMNVAIDVAHGDMQTVHAFTQKLSVIPWIAKIMSGSICTVEAAKRATAAGCTHLRVGIGPGAACTTRLMTGVGLPNLSAVYRIYNELKVQKPGKYLFAKEQNVKIIADGGIKHPGDVNKYMAAGADGAMLGSVFSKAFESKGWEEVPVEFTANVMAVNGPNPQPTKLVKTYRGQASEQFQRETFGKANQCAEGDSSDSFAWDNRTSATTITNKFVGGARSAISYLGLVSTAKLKPENVTFVKVTPSGYLEGTPHGV